MNIQRKIYLLFGSALLLLLQTGITQNCVGPLNVMTSGSFSSEPLTIDITATGITCASDANGNIVLGSSGGNPSYQYSWEDIVTNDSIRNNLPEGTYNATVTDAEGCSEIISWTVAEMNPDNSDLAMTDGCGVCLLDDGGSSYFFNEDTKYIASLTDQDVDTQELGDTEVCLFRDPIVQACEGAPYLQRQWSVNPTTEQYSCLKLFFTKAELENLAAAIPTETVSAQELIDNQRLCLTALVGGTEDCNDYQHATIYSLADAPPLVITQEDPVQDIWSVSVCTDEFATFYLHVCDIPLPVELLYFRGLREGNTNALYWETAIENNTAYFELQKSPINQDNFSILSGIPASGNSTTNKQYSYIDYNPSLLDYYRLKIIDEDGSFEFSNIVAIKNNIVAPSILYPSIFEDQVFYETELTVADELEFLVYDAIGRRAFRQRFKLKRGTHKLTLKLDRLIPGAYFVEVISRKRDPEIFKIVSRKE